MAAVSSGEQLWILNKCRPVCNILYPSLSPLLNTLSFAPFLSVLLDIDRERPFFSYLGPLTTLCPADPSTPPLLSALSALIILPSLSRNLSLISPPLPSLALHGDGDPWQGRVLERPPHVEDRRLRRWIWPRQPGGVPQRVPVRDRLTCGVCAELHGDYQERRRRGRRGGGFPSWVNSPVDSVLRRRPKIPRFSHLPQQTRGKGEVFQGLLGCANLFYLLSVKALWYGKLGMAPWTHHFT